MNSQLVDWCRGTALPVLEAAAAGQPIGHAAERAMRSLVELLAVLGESSDRRDAERWHSLCSALDAGGDSGGRLAKAIAGGSDALERLIDTMSLNRMGECA